MKIEGYTLVEWHEGFAGKAIIPQGIKEIGYRAFYHCPKLTEVVIPDGVERIDDEAFYYCGGLCFVTIPKSVRVIGSKAFYGTSLFSIEIPMGLEKILGCAFAKCRNLLDVNLPSSVSCIGSHAFAECDSLKSLNIPVNIHDIGYDVVDDSCKLPVIDNIIYAGTYLLHPSDKTKDSYKIREGTKIIGVSAFASCRNIQEIEIPNSVQKIMHDAFSDLHHLKSIKIPYGVEIIEGRTFSNCTELNSIKIPYGVKRIEAQTFSNCTELKSIYLPSSLLFVDYSAFSGCINLEVILIPKGSKDKFMQFKSLENFKFMISEEGGDDVTSSTFHGNEILTRLEGKSILLYYAEQAESDNKIDIAISLYEDAVKLGSIEADYKLGCLLLEKDFHKGYYFLNKASQSGYNKAKEKIEELQLKRPTD